MVKKGVLFACHHFGERAGEPPARTPSARGSSVRSAPPAGLPASAHASQTVVSTARRLAPPIGRTSGVPDLDGRRITARVRMNRWLTRTFAGSRAGKRPGSVTPRQ